MNALPDVEALLAGPRGRRLCWALLGAPQLEPPGLAGAPQTADAAQIIRPAVAEFGGADPARVFAALAQAVDMAAYWQPPYHEDEILTDLAAELVPVAEAVLAAPATEWWSTPLALDDQVLTQFLDGPASPAPPVPSDPAARLRAWREDEQRSNERFRAVREGRDQQPVRRPGPTLYREPGDGQEEIYARMSGTWWSTPNRWEISLTARELPGAGPIALWLTEDELGWEHAHCWPAAATRAPRVYEITGPQAWADLVAGHPLDVTDSRRPDWRRATGSDGPWLIPDWSAVAAEFDAVHLTVFGYLTTAGRAVAVDETHRSVLAGWDPDATFWLTDRLTLAGPGETWVRDDEHEWVRAGG